MVSVITTLNCTDSMSSGGMGKLVTALASISSQPNEVEETTAAKMLPLLKVVGNQLPETKVERVEQAAGLDGALVQTLISMLEILNGTGAAGLKETHNLLDSLMAAEEKVHAPFVPAVQLTSWTLQTSA